MPEILDYEELKTRLDKSIALMEKKIAIIDDLRSNKEKTPTTEQMEILSSVEGLHTEGTALALQAKSNARAKQGIDYQPVVIKDQASMDKVVNIVKQKADSKQPFHYDLIVQLKGNHCTALQIDSDGDTTKLFCIDSVPLKDHLYNMWGMLEIAELVKAEINIYPEGGIQTSSRGCDTFSIQNLNTMSNLGAKNLEQYLLPMSSKGKISQLHPRFVKSAQSRRAINENLSNEENKTLIVSKNKTLEQHVEDYSITVELAEQATGKIAKKTQNRAFDYKALKYLQSARNELEKIYQKGGEELLQEVIAERTGGIIFSPRPVHELTKADKYKIMQSTKDILTSNHKDIISFNNEMDKFIDQLTIDKIGKQANEQDKQQIRERIEAKLEKIITKSPDKEIFTQALQLMKQKDTVKDIGNIMCNQKLSNGSNKTTSLPNVQQQKHKARHGASM